MERVLIASVAEFIGTFALIFMGCGAACTDALSKGAAGLLGNALANGVTIAVLVSATMFISGGLLNPALTVALVARRKIGIDRALAYVVAQLLGAALAAACVKAVFPTGTFDTAGVTPDLHRITAAQGILAEAIATFFLMFVVFGTALDRRAHNIGGFGIGLVIVVDVLAVGTLTGASMNPARTFGPALVANHWMNHYVYWVGPLLGAVVATFVYDLLFLKPKPEPTLPERMEKDA